MSSEKMDRGRESTSVIQRKYKIDKALLTIWTHVLHCFSFRRLQISHLFCVIRGDFAVIAWLSVINSFRGRHYVFSVINNGLFFKPDQA